MKEGIHPKYVDCVITCACGEVIHTRSTKPEIRVEVCSKCHPFYTGKQKLVDSGGRVDRFKKRFGIKDCFDNEKQPCHICGKVAFLTGGGRNRMESYTTIRGVARATLVEKKSEFIASASFADSEEAALRFLESVMVSTMTATPLGP